LKVHQLVPIQFATTKIDFNHSIDNGLIFTIDFAIKFQFSLPYTLEKKGETFMGV